MWFLFGYKFSWYELGCIYLVSEIASDAGNPWWFVSLVPLAGLQIFMDRRLGQ